MDHDERQKQQKSDRAAVRFPPPLVYVVAIMVAVGLQSVGWGFEISLSNPIRVTLCAVFVATGLGIVMLSLGLFRRTGQKPEPWTSTPEIITSGIYGYTRNPMYLGMALTQVGIGFGLENAWVIILVLPTFWVVNLFAIRHEETYLADKFGESYLSYKQRVRRWL